MPPISGGQGTCRQILYLSDDTGEEDLKGVTVGAGEIPRVREGIGEGVNDCAPPNPACRGEGGTGAGR